MEEHQIYVNDLNFLLTKLMSYLSEEQLKDYELWLKAKRLDKQYGSKSMEEKRH